jgi:hypothetical protein
MPDTAHILPGAPEAGVLVMVVGLAGVEALVEAVVLEEGLPRASGAEGASAEAIGVAVFTLRGEIYLGAPKKMSKGHEIFLKHLHEKGGVWYAWF